MTLKLTSVQWVLVGAAALVGGVLFGILGLAVALDFLYSRFEVREFNGLIGWEAQGAAGFVIGAPIGFGLSAWGSRALLLRRKAR